MTNLTNECPVCGAMLDFGSTPLIGELKDCMDCGVELEVTGIEPLTLTEAPNEEEDWGE